MADQIGTRGRRFALWVTLGISVSLTISLSASWWAVVNLSDSNPSGRWPSPLTKVLLLVNGVSVLIGWGAGEWLTRMTMTTPDRRKRMIVFLARGVLIGVSIAIAFSAIMVLDLLRKGPGVMYGAYLAIPLLLVLGGFIGGIIGLTVGVETVTSEEKRQQQAIQGTAQADARPGSRQDPSRDGVQPAPKPEAQSVEELDG